MLATGGGLVFTGDAQGYFTALDARTGKPLWNFQAGGGLGAPAITYTLNGRQQIAVAAGSSIITFQLVDAK
jgi:outer membrane protein assembly factor BamB